MGTEITEISDEDLGPAMRKLTALRRRFVEVYLEHPTYSATAIAREAGFTDNPDWPGQVRVAASRAMRDENVIAAIHEEGSKRLRSGGLMAVAALLDVIRNPNHKDHLKAVGMAMDRTGYHAMSEHKVTVDDKRPQTREELIEAVKKIAAEAGLSEAEAAKLTDADVVEGEFTEFVVEDEIKVEDL